MWNVISPGMVLPKVKNWLLNRRQPAFVLSFSTTAIPIFCTTKNTNGWPCPCNSYRDRAFTAINYFFAELSAQQVLFLNRPPWQRFFIYPCTSTPKNAWTYTRYLKKKKLINIPLP